MLPDLRGVVGGEGGDAEICAVDGVGGSVDGINENGFSRFLQGGEEVWMEPGMQAQVDAVEAGGCDVFREPAPEPGFSAKAVCGVAVEEPEGRCGW